MQLSALAQLWSYATTGSARARYAMFHRSVWRALDSPCRLGQVVLVPVVLTAGRVPSVTDSEIASLLLTTVTLIV